MYPTPEMPAFGTFVHDQVEALRRAGVEIDVLYINGRQSRWNYIRGFLRYWRQLRRGRYDLVHAHYVLTGIIARVQWGKRVVLTHHGVEALGYPRWQARLCKVMTPLCDAAIHVSEEVRRTLRDADGWVIPCGVDLDAFVPLPRDEARAQLGLPPSKRLILWAGEPWRPEKQFHLVERALPLVQRELPDAELVLLTNQPHHRVPVYMSACDALVLTSRYEGSPMVVKEAMACNLPVVSVPVGDVPEVIGGVPGCLLTAPDPADIAAKLIAVLREPRRTDGRARIDHLRHDRVAERVLGVYTATLAPK
jgi:glycosyltransferase involved in cell wall biosynthesis